MNKTALKNFAVWARRKLIADIQFKAGMVGVTEDGIAEPLPQSTREVQFFDVGTQEYTAIRGDEIQQRDRLVNEIRNKEIKRPPSAKEYADQAKERHEDFQKQSVVSVTDIRNDQKDKEIIEGEVIRRIKKTLGAINELYVLIDAGEVPVNILSDEGKKIVIRTLAEMQNCIDMIGNIIGKR